MNNQDIANALRDLEPEEAAQIALNYLREQDYVLKVWSRDDISSSIDQDPTNADLTPEQRSEVIDIAVNDTGFRNLEDATEQDWDVVYQAISDALVQVRS